MRNLKKILALVLALMMVVSMMVTASATSFTDDASINEKYVEAVSVLTGAGVIRGMENADGSFRFDPKGALNRAQAATIIAYVMRGTLDTIADEVSVYENPFTDVAEWAVPYVLFAHSNGIVVGRNATTYDPNGTITGYELGKMLLIAGGYAAPDAFATTVYVVDGKAYVDRDDALVASLNAGGAAITTKVIGNSDWQVTVASGLKNAKIWANEFALSKKLTREEACYLAFNALTDAEGQRDDTNFFNFGLVVSADVDEFGRTTKVWSAGEKKLVTLDNYAAPQVVVATKGADITVDGINALLGLTKADDKMSFAENIEVYLNGDDEYAGEITIGDTVEIFATKKAISKIVIIRETLAKASVASEAVKDGDNKGLYEWSFGTAAVTYAAKDAYTKDAYYLVVANSDKDLLNIANPTLINKAKITKADKLDLSDATYVVVNDQKLVKAGEIAISGGFATEFDFALNSNGYLIGVAAAGTYVKAEEPDEYKGETGYAYLMAAEKQVTTNVAGSSLIGGETAYSWDVVAVAQLAMGDGTFGIVKLPVETTKNKDTGVVEGLKINGVVVEDVNNTDLTKILTDIYGWVEYEIQENGDYKLTAVTDFTTVTLEKGISQVASGKYATSSTVWTHYEVNPKTGVVTTTVKVGLNDYPVDANYEGTTYEQALVTTDTNNAKVVTEIVTFGEYKAPAGSVVEGAYFNGAGEFTADGQGYAFYVDGVLTNYFMGTLVDNTEDDYDITDAGKLGNDIYKLTLDADGKIVNITTYAHKTGVVVEYVDDEIAVIGGKVYYFYGTDIYNVSTGDAADVDVIEVGDTVTIAYEYYHDKAELKFVYITKEAE